MKLLLLTSLFLYNSLVFSQSDNVDASAKTSHETEMNFDHSHSKWTTLLKNFVITKGAVTQVNYESFKESQKSLEEYLNILSRVKKDDFNTWSDKQKMAFWMNAYNAFTVQLILKHYPVKSIKDIGGFFSSPWKKEFFKIFGKDFYLDKIEHEVLRKNFKEPRIHFAVNCASIGCPSLRDEAFTAENLNAQLEEQAKQFLTFPERNRVDRENKKIYLSKIFKWFKEDFGDKKANIISYVFPYMKQSGDKIEDWQKYSLQYTDYDWNLNEVKN